MKGFRVKIVKMLVKITGIGPFLFFEQETPLEAPPPMLTNPSQTILSPMLTNPSQTILYRRNPTPM